jgi:DNA ligase (NAD+)
MSLIPTTCPSCNSELVLSATGIDLFCQNTASCPAQINLKLSYFTSRGIANISGLSDKILEKLIAKFNISDPLDLFDLDYDKISQMDGLGIKSAKNIELAVEKVRTTLPDYRFLAGLSIDGIGPEIAKLILGKIQIA